MPKMWTTSMHTRIPKSKIIWSALNKQMCSFNILKSKFNQDNEKQISNKKICQMKQIPTSNKDSHTCWLKKDQNQKAKERKGENKCFLLFF